MNQDEYRALQHFRAAIMKETGEAIFIDDVTFNPDAHEELAPVAPAAPPE